MLKDLLPGAQIFAAAPGRVNLLGEHVDYNDGMVLPAAIDRSVRVLAEPLEGTVVSLLAVDFNESTDFDLRDLNLRKDIRGRPLPAWALYPAGVALALQQHGFSTPAFRAAFHSNVPIGAGLSSSAAVEVMFAALWQHLGRWEVTRMRLAQLCQEAENRYVGVNCGLMDQFASAHGVAGHALYFDVRSLHWEPVPLPANAVIVIADSGVRRSLTTSAYNERRAACEEAVRLLQPVLPGIRALRDVTPALLEQHRSCLPELVYRRARHVVEECDRMRQAPARLKTGDAAGFGALMYAGHASLRDLYEVSVPELDALVETAASLPGCWGARLTGAGFGGCTVNLVEESAADGFIAGLRDGYRKRTGRQVEVYLCRASDGVRVGKEEWGD